MALNARINMFYYILISNEYIESFVFFGVARRGAIAPPINLPLTLVTYSGFAKLKVSGKLFLLRN